LVVALEGWVDAGLGSTTAIAALLGRGSTETIVTFNGEHFLDQRARRPVARIVNGVTTELTWPRTVVRQGTDEGGRDILFLVGPEPDFHWRAFTDAVVGLARSWRVRMVVGLGAFPAPAPHTRPVRLAATAPEGSSHLIEQVGIVQGELEVPAGVLSALEMAFVPRSERGTARRARRCRRFDDRLLGAATSGRQLPAPGGPADL
jgi:hypothetical protein